MISYCARTISFLFVSFGIGCVAQPRLDSTNDNARTEKADNAAELAELEIFLDGVTGLFFEKLSTEIEGYTVYKIRYKQWIVQEDHSKGAFLQHAILHHISRDAPMILVPQGYDLRSQTLTDLTRRVQGNQLKIEHRFYGNSIPGDLPEMGSALTTKRAAADIHRFVEVFKFQEGDEEIGHDSTGYYTGRWVSTGTKQKWIDCNLSSRWWPDDVDATVAYVAPISFDILDSRYVSFMDSIGTEHCRNAIRDLQRALLKRKGVEDTLGKGRAWYERWIVRFEWSFWQREGIKKCDEIANLINRTDEEIVSFILERESKLTATNERWRKAYNYQVLTERGNRRYATEHLNEELLHYTDQWSNPHNLIFNPAVMMDIQDWVCKEGSEIIFIYGQYDPWTGGAFEIDNWNGTECPGDMLKVVAPEAGHYNTSIATLDVPEQDAVLNRLSTWTGISFY